MFEKKNHIIFKTSFQSVAKNNIIMYYKKPVNMALLVVICVSNIKHYRKITNIICFSIIIKMCKASYLKKCDTLFIASPSKLLKQSKNKQKELINSFCKTDFYPSLCFYVCKYHLSEILISIAQHRSW